jgi:hypothetical protein
LCCPISLPAGICRPASTADWEDFRRRFGLGTPRRLWLFGSFRALVRLAASTGKLRRVFIWGTFVTTKRVPKDVDVLLIMHEGFDVERAPVAAQVVFNSIRSKLLFESDVLWARASIGGIVELELQ